MTRPLDGVTVLDLATFIAAPMCCTLLGEFGAEVIKVERPGAGDDLRRLGTRAEGQPTYWWSAESRNKKSITCDLRTRDGQELIKRLVSRTDVVAENFRPGTMERWNLGYDELRSVNAGVVMVRISGFGQTGPYRDRPGFGRIASAMSGIMYLSGYPDRPPLTPGTPTLPDYLAGTYAALGALLALRHRDASGEGQVVDVALYEPLLRMLDELIPVHGATGYVRERIGSGTEYVVPHNTYPTADGRWVAVACTNDRMFERLAVGVLGLPELLERFPTVADRVAHREEMDELVQGWMEQRSAQQAIASLEAAEVPCSLANSVADLFSDPHVRSRENIMEFQGDADEPPLSMAGIVPKLSRTPGRVDSLGPREVGAHNEEIYCGRLGLSSDELSRLQAQGVV